MILYFSATGNCQYVAARLAQADGQSTLSIVDCIRENRYAFADETIGIVSPTYDWSLPNIVREFLEKASFQTEYLYFVATYGTTPGATGYMAQKAIRGCQISAYYSVRMPDTYADLRPFHPGKGGEVYQNNRNGDRRHSFRGCGTPHQPAYGGTHPGLSHRVDRPAAL